METERDLVTRASELPLHPQDEIECRRCDVHCDKVVYPAACIARSCPFVYAYREFGHTYMGCLQKVFKAEIDVELFREAELTRHGFGGVKMTGMPLPQCRTTVERAYDGYDEAFDCVNPGFFEKPVPHEHESAFDLRDNL